MYRSPLSKPIPMFVRYGSMLIVAFAFGAGLSLIDGNSSEKTVSVAYAELAGGCRLVDAAEESSDQLTSGKPSDPCLRFDSEVEIETGTDPCPEASYPGSAPPQAAIRVTVLETVSGCSTQSADVQLRKVGGVFEDIGSFSGNVFNSACDDTGMTGDLKVRLVNTVGIKKWKAELICCDCFDCSEFDAVVSGQCAVVIGYNPCDGCEAFPLSGCGCVGDDCDQLLESPFCGS